MIGIIGGYGEVGRQAYHILKKCQNMPLKVGGRNPEKGNEEYGNELPDALWQQVDMLDEDSLRHFVSDCELVLNCAGPSCRVSMRIARTCIENGCHVVDAGFERGMESLPLVREGQTVLYAAGATPGLSGLLPIWFARQFDKVHEALIYTVALDKFSPTGAEDYLEGVMDETNIPSAAWQNGTLIRGALKREATLTLPFFDHELTAYPIFDEETLHIARELELTEGKWYFASEGEKMPVALDTASINYKKAPKETIEKMCLASALDLAGRDPYFNQLMQFHGEIDGVSTVKTAFMKSQGGIKLTGSVAAACVIAILKGKVRADRPIPAAAISDQSFVVEFLVEHHIIDQLQILNFAIEELKEEEEGVL